MVELWRCCQGRVLAGDGLRSDGATGLKALGIRDLTYRIAFLALFVKPQVELDTLSELHDLERDSAEHGGMLLSI
jgi:hypothetical protein